MQHNIKYNRLEYYDGYTTETERSYPSGAPSSFSGIRVAQSM